jgi:hypothetical protein
MREHDDGVFDFDEKEEISYFEDFKNNKSILT